MPDDDKRLVWLSVDDEDAWTLASITARDGRLYARRARAPDGVDIEVQVTEEQLSERSVPLGGSKFEPPPDLVALPSITVAAVLHTLRCRHEIDQIYTAVGPVIVAVNPFKPTAESTPDRMDELIRTSPDALPPHCFNAARSAYTVMQATGQPQSILISGESGAGKTETAKIVMSCLSKLSGSSAATTAHALDSGLLLEAFGNAQTVHNNNSSRYGKWVEVGFDVRGSISACKIRSFLLEQTRVVRHSAGERNYHVFYQLLAGSSDKERQAYGLDPQANLSGCACEYPYLVATSGGDGEKGSDKDETLPTDAGEWRATRRRMGTLGFSEAQIVQVGQMLIALLILGDVAFAPASEGVAQGEAEDCKARCVAPDKLAAAAKLLGLPNEALKQKLLERMVKSGRGTIYQLPYSAQQSCDARDSIAMNVFSRTFEWLIDTMNERGLNGEGGVNSEGSSHFIGLLDIFGFENFAHNSLEQLCINYANEKLQAQFIGALVANQREEYAAEGINVGSIVFPTNDEQLELLEGKIGVLSMLDEECLLPQSSEAAYVAKMHKRFQPIGCYLEPKPTGGRGRGGRGRGGAGGTVQDTAFCIQHYAGAVTYDAAEWVPKNKASLPAGVEAMLSASKLPLLAALYAPSDSACGGGGKEAAEGTSSPNSSSSCSPRRSAGSAGGGGGAHHGASTVLGRFRGSLRKLFATLQQTSMRFVRCIKPNTAKVAGRFDGRFVERQLLYNGVLAIVEIQAAGYAVSLPKNQFVHRYFCCCASFTTAEARSMSQIEMNPDGACTALLAAARRSVPPTDCAGSTTWESPADWQLGRTKIFLRDQMMRALERSRTVAASAAATRVQSSFRSWLHRRAVRRLRDGKTGMANVRTASNAVEARALLEALYDAFEADGAASDRRLLRAVPAVGSVVHHELEKLHDIVEGRELEAAARAEEEAAVRRATEAAAKAKEEEEARARAAEAEARRLQEEKEAAQAEARRAEEAAKAEAEAKKAKEKEEARRAAEARDAASRQQAAQAATRTAKACEHYSVDMSALTFGDCKCGWPKAAHVVGASAPSGASARRDGPRTIATFMAKNRDEGCVGAPSGTGAAACTEYRVDMTATRFGDCKCGRPKVEHSTSAIQAGATGALAPQDTPVDLRHPGGGRAARRAALRAMVQDKLDDVEQAQEGLGSTCKAYRIDMTAARFGDCVCGQPKALHREAALRANVAKR